MPQAHPGARDRGRVKVRVNVGVRARAQIRVKTIITDIIMARVWIRASSAHIAADSPIPT